MNIENESKINEYKDYLRSTDWYYTRKLETGEEVPKEVVVSRKVARDFIKINENV